MDRDLSMRKGMLYSLEAIFLDEPNSTHKLNIYLSYAAYLLDILDSFYFRNFLKLYCSSVHGCCLVFHAPEGATAGKV